jgi:hypothetical protein
MVGDRNRSPLTACHVHLPDRAKLDVLDLDWRKVSAGTILEPALP